MTLTALSEDQRAIVESVSALMRDFDDDYWLARDREGRFPTDFHQAMAKAGWLGIAMPQSYGGAGLGICEAAVMMARVADSPGAMAAASAIHMNIFGPHPIVKFGSEAQKQNWLPPLIAGEQRCCFAVTEPDAGLDTGEIATRAEADGDGYRITGQKIWTSTAQEADKVLLLARTKAKEDCARPIEGLSLFYTDLDRRFVEVREIEKMGRAAVDSNQLFFDGLPVPRGDLIGEEGQGFHYILHGLNPERVLVAAEAVGIGRQALHRAASYAQDRKVFARPIGQNQAVQHPLARSWMELEAARAYDAGEAAGLHANAAKVMASEAGHKACERALLAHGGLGYAKEFHIERLLREAMIPRLAPISNELCLCYIAEKALGLPKSY